MRPQPTALQRTPFRRCMSSAHFTAPGSPLMPPCLPGTVACVPAWATLDLRQHRGPTGIKPSATPPRQHATRCGDRTCASVRSDLLLCCVGQRVRPSLMRRAAALGPSSCAHRQTCRQPLESPLSTLHAIRPSNHRLHYSSESQCCCFSSSSRVACRSRTLARLRRRARS